MRSRWIPIALAVLVPDAGVLVAIGRSHGSNCPAVPTPSSKHFGGFANNRGWFGVDAALDMDNLALQAFLDARVQGSCAEAWIGKGVKIGRGLSKGNEGTYYGWSLYTFHDSPLCIPPGGSVGGTERFGKYSIQSRQPTDTTGAVGSHIGIGNTLTAAPGRYSYAIGIGTGDTNVTMGSMREFIDVVGPGVNRNGKRMPAVILGEFEQVLFSSCAPQDTPLVGV